MLLKCPRFKAAKVVSSLTNFSLRLASATSEDDRLIYPVQKEYVDRSSPVWNNNNNITDNNNNNNNSNNNWDEKTRVLDPPQYDNSTCDKPRSLFPPPLL